MKTLAALLLSITFLIGCNQSDKSGQQFLSDLGHLIKRADRIDVVEHSSPLDFLHAEEGKIVPSKEIAYSHIRLTEKQKERFRSMIEGLTPKTQNAFPACIFEAHHRIEFFAKEKLIDSIEVCFGCGQVEWHGSKSTPPWSLYRGLEAFILSVGMQPKQDWASLAAKGGK